MDGHMWVQIIRPETHSLQWLNPLRNSLFLLLGFGLRGLNQSLGAVPTVLIESLLMYITTITAELGLKIKVQKFTSKRCDCTENITHMLYSGQLSYKVCATIQTY